VSNVTDMSSLFFGATAFNQNLSSWNVSNVTTMSKMFDEATAFNQNISSWDVSNVTEMSYMFSGATAFNQDISSWDVSNVTNMGGMFNAAIAFNQNLSSWNVSNVTDMSDMFKGVTLSTANYDALLVGWNNLALKPNVSFHGGNSKYTASSTAETARANMISNDGWTIIDDGALKLAQTITFTNPGNKNLDDTLTLGATADSGLSVSYLSTTTPVCTVNATTGDVTLLNIGSCSITASQAGDATYAAAPDVPQTFTVNVAPPPNAPTNLSGSASKTKINLSWTDNSNDETGFKVERDGALITTTAADANSYSDSGLFCGTTYSYSVKATNANGDSTAATTSVKTEACLSVFHELTVNKIGNGTITASDGINCGNDCEQEFLYQSEITLTATPETSWIFEGWTGDCNRNGTVTMDSDKSCTATFIEGYPLNIVVTGKGKIKTATQECQEKSQEIMALNATTTLIAEPEVEWVLDSWSGDCDDQGHVEMTSEKTCIANFIPDPNIPNDGDGNGDGAQDVDQPHIISMPDSVSGEYITITIDESVNLTEIYTDLAENQFDESIEFPQGVVYFEIEGSETDVTIYYHGLETIYNPSFQKFGTTTPGDISTIGWYTMSNVTFGMVTIGGKNVVTAQYHLKDGELGDNTGVDGRIIDPGGITTSTDFDNVIGLITKTENVSTKTGEATLIVSRSGREGSVSVDYATANGSAIATQDYQTTSGTLTWEKGERADKTIIVPILAGATTGRAFTINLTNLTVSEPQTAVLGLQSTTVNIYSNVISFAAANEKISIQAGNTDLVVSRSGEHNDVSVDYTTVNDTAIANTDYQPITGTLTWKEGDNADKTISLSLLNEAMIGKALNVVLSNLTVTHPQTQVAVEDGILEINTVAVTIMNEDENVIGFTSRAYNALKKDGVATVTVKRSGDIQGEVAVDYSTIDATALANQDYQATEGTLTWANGENGEKTFTVTLLAGATLGNSLLVSLDNVNGAKMDMSMAVLTIREDSEDEPPPTEENTNQDTLVNATTNPGDVISNVTLQGEIDNQATLQDVNIALDTTVTGGKLDGTITSEGVIKDVTIKPTTIIYGGYAAGTIYNEGILVAITIKEGTVIIGGILIGPIRNKGTIKDAILRGSISGGYYDGVVVNRGLLANANVMEGARIIGGRMTGSSINNGTMIDFTITQYARVSGGQYSGDIDNKGTLTDATILSGATVTGGTINGNINSEGTLQNVELTEDVQIRGGKLAGKISGDPDKSAQIGAVEIAPHTKLTHVRLSPTVQLPDDIVLGYGVILPAEPPTSEDFGLPAEEIAELDAERITELEPEVFGTLDADTVEAIPADAFAAVGPEQLAHLENESVAGITKEQFAEMPIEALGGLTSENMGGLPTELVGELTPEHLTALDKDEFQEMPSKDVSKLFTNLDLDNISPQDVEELLPPGWELNPITGALDAPVGAELSFQSLPPSDLPSQVTLPTTANLNTGLGIDGSGPTLLEGTKRSLENEDLTDFVLSQEGETGILLVEGTGDSAGITFTFTPDVNNAIQVDTGKTPIGLGVGNGGFYTITTPEGEQYKVVPAPKDPVALSEVIGGGEVVLGKRGDVMLERVTQVKRGGRTREVLIFDPLIEPGIDDSCVEIIPGEFTCNDLRSGQRGLTQPLQTRKIQYPDGTAQTIHPTVLSPDVFIKEALKFEGVENIVFNANGTFYVVHKSKGYLILPNFEVQSEEMPEEESVVPRIEINEDGGQLRYTIPIESSENDNRRRGRTREVLIFDPLIEPAPDDMCVEMIPGEIVCRFD
ncbi:MAG: BspA family leucine-rich repeat surface protein, partial [Thiomargarita sp.]|nr:BspA family leucine-rich repeat surface protein [Thiomargarita sp.]